MELTVEILHLRHVYSYSTAVCQLEILKVPKEIRSSIQSITIM